MTGARVLFGVTVVGATLPNQEEVDLASAKYVLFAKEQELSGWGYVGPIEASLKEYTARKGPPKRIVVSTEFTIPDNLDLPVGTELVRVEKNKLSCATLALFQE